MRLGRSWKLALGARLIKTIKIKADIDKQRYRFDTMKMSLKPFHDMLITGIGQLRCSLHGLY